MKTRVTHLPAIQLDGGARALEHADERPVVCATALRKVGLGGLRVNTQAHLACDRQARRTRGLTDIMAVDFRQDGRAVNGVDGGQSKQR